MRKILAIGLVGIILLVASSSCASASSEEVEVEVSIDSVTAGNTATGEVYVKNNMDKNVHVDVFLVVPREKGVEFFSDGEKVSSGKEHEIASVNLASHGGEIIEFSILTDVRTKSGSLEFEVLAVAEYEEEKGKKEKEVVENRRVVPRKDRTIEERETDSFVYPFLALLVTVLLFIVVIIAREKKQDEGD